MPRLKLWSTLVVLFTMIYCIAVISIVNFLKLPHKSRLKKVAQHHNINWHDLFYLEASTDKNVMKNSTVLMSTTLGLSHLKRGDTYSTPRTHQQKNQTKSFGFRDDFTAPATMDKYAFQLMDYKPPAYTKTRAPCFVVDKLSR